MTKNNLFLFVLSVLLPVTSIMADEESDCIAKQKKLYASFDSAELERRNAPYLPQATAVQKELWDCDRKYPLPKDPCAELITQFNILSQCVYQTLHKTEQGKKLYNDKGNEITTCQKAHHKKYTLQLATHEEDMKSCYQKINEKHPGEVKAEMENIVKALQTNMDYQEKMVPKKPKK